MHIFTKIYEFAASAGAFEGYVYRREGIEIESLAKWIGNLISTYGYIPPETREEFQTSLDGTLGRAIRSLIPIIGEEHEFISKLKSMVVGPLPKSADDFQKTKWFEK